MIAIGILAVLSAVFFYRDLLAISYDDEFARLRGVPVNLVYFFHIALVAVSVVIIIRVVGLILVIALLTIPPYIAEKYCRSLGAMMILATLLAMVFNFIGLWLAYTYNLTSGAAIILVAAAGFFASMTGDAIFQKKPAGTAKA
jgi:zinc transport system permease protein